MPEKLRKVLSETLAQLEIENRIEEELSLYHWEETVGKEISRQTQPRFVKGRVLFVATSSAMWAQELDFIKEELLKKLNARLKRKLKDIRFQPRGKKPTDLARHPPAAGQDTQAKINGVRLEPRDVEEINNLTQEISHRKVRKRLTEFFILDRKLKVWKLSQGWKPCPTCSLLIPQGKSCVRCRAGGQE